MSELLSFFSYAFFIRALIAGVLISAVLSWLSPYIVLRREIIFTHTISHFSFLGIVIALIFDLPINISILVFCLFSAFLIDIIQKKALFKKDAILEILSQSGLSVSIIILSLSKGFKIDLWQYLFGDILGISNADLITLGSIALASTIIIYLYHNNFLQISLSSTLSQNVKNKRLINFLFVGILAIIIGLSIKIVGILLVSAFIAIPSNIAKIYSKNLNQTFILSVIVGILAVLSGLILSALYDIPSGATIVSILSFIWLISAVFYRYKK